MERQSIQTVYPRVYGIVHGVDQGVLKLSLINNRKYMVGTIHNGQLTTASKSGLGRTSTSREHCSENYLKRFISNLFLFFPFLFKNINENDFQIVRSHNQCSIMFKASILGSFKRPAATWFKIYGGLIY